MPTALLPLFFILHPPSSILALLLLPRAAPIHPDAAPEAVYSYLTPRIIP
ncbi:MAG: hypothetical protein ABSC18_05805 [Verrucomicrobiota bacterium]